MSNPDPNPFADISHELLVEGCSVRFRAEGDSMRPTIVDGDRLVVEPCTSAQARVGDILFYRAPGRPLAHRLVQIVQAAEGRTQFILRGDGLEACDAPVDAEAILGRAVAVERGGQRVPLATRRAKLTQRARVAAGRVKRRLTFSSS